MFDKVFLRHTFYFFRDFFWYSEKKNKARLLFFLILLLTIASVVLTGFFATWNLALWQAFSTINLNLFLNQMLIFGLLVTAALTIHSLKKYLKETLIVEWRAWLTQKMMNEYVNPEQQSYLKLVREHKNIDNPGQRIEEDIHNFVYYGVHHFFDLIKSTMKFVTFIGSLWLIGGSLSLSLLGMSLTIPGYLVWVALSFSVIASYITHKLGRYLNQITQKAEIKDAKFRSVIDETHLHAENIAIEHAEQFYHQVQESRLKKIIKLTYQKIILDTKLEGFRTVYRVLAGIFPLLVAAPIYFSGLITLAQMMQISFYFSEINHSLSWFIEAYENIASFKASCLRISGLQTAITQDKFQESRASISRECSDSTTAIILEHLNIQKPQDQATILNDLNITFTRGQHTLIQGQTAIGKSTLFKAISGTWAYGQGSIKLPANDKIMCLPQFITVPEHLTLRQIIAYPHTTDSIDWNRFNEISELIPVLKANLESLDTKKIIWNQRLSGGEKQQIAFARALLEKPQWLLLDETSASLDSVTEARMYEILKTKLADTTILSISHKPHLKEHHHRVISLSSYLPSV